MEIEFICLAVSRKHNGKCIAGIRSDGAGWIRPVSNTDDGTLSVAQCSFNNSDLMRPLDLVSAKFTKNRPECHQPENWVLADSKFNLITRPISESNLDLVSKHIVTGPRLLGNTLDHIPYATLKASPAKSSLAIVAPKNLKWEVRSWSGKLKSRVLFSLGDVDYNLSVSDPLWENKIKGLGVGVHKGLSLVDKNKEVWLTISTSEPFSERNDNCYKLCATIIVVPR